MRAWRRGAVRPSAARRRRLLRVGTAVPPMSPVGPVTVPSRPLERPDAEPRRPVETRPAWRLTGPSRPSVRDGGRGGCLVLVWRLFVAFYLLGLVLSATWSQPSREETAAAAAQAICSIRPQPKACAPNGKPSDFFGQLLETFG